MASSGRFIGGISVGVSMDTKRLRKDAMTSKGILHQFAGAAKTIFAAVGVSAAGVGASLTAGIRKSMESIDQLAKTADKVGITTEALAGLQHAAELSGVNAAMLDKALVNLTKNTADAATGVGEAVKAYEMMGLSARKLNMLSPDKQFLAIADSITKVANQQDQLNIATKLFGVRGSALINVLRLGSDELADAAKEAAQLGLAVSRVDAAQVEEANDAITRMKESFQGITNILAIELAPTITKVMRDLKEFVLVAKSAATGSGVATQRGDFFSFMRSIGFEQTGGGLMGALGYGSGRNRGSVGPSNRVRITGTASGGANANMGVMTGAQLKMMYDSFANSQMGGDIKQAISRNLSQMGTSAGMMARTLGLSDAMTFSGLFLKRMAKNALGIDVEKAQKEKAIKAPSQGPPSLFETGTREAYEQRVRIQNRSDSIENKQLDQLKKIADNTARNNGGVTLSPANLSG